MQRVAHRLVCRLGHRLVALASLGAVAGCRLGPLVDDQPGASASVLPKDATVPIVTRNPDLATQIAINDGLDSNALLMNGNVITRGTTGFAADGTQVKYWALGAADLAPTPIYFFGSGDPMSASFMALDHPPLVGAVPGDLEYQPVHTIYRVAVTDKYNGERITTLAALSDAIELQLIQAPVAIKVFVNWPIVRAGLKLEVGGADSPIGPTPVYAHGYAVDSFPLGGVRGLQPNPFGILPTSQVSFLRESGKPAYDPSRPIFQATIPAAPAQTTSNYTPISAVVNVDLVANKPATDIHRDSDLFTRDMNGNITSSTSNVARFTVTSQLLDLQIQFAEGSP